VLDEVIAALADGQSRTLVIRGEAGIGKTALLEYLVGTASGLTVLRAVGVESEMELAYASVHQVCAPMLDRLERLPTPQRKALRITFGLSGGPAPDPLLVGLAVLGVLSEVAAERPLLCIVDDAQWLDRASAQTLAFVARRLLAERVGLVFAARDPGEELHGLPELELQGLDNGDARELLSSVVRFVLDERVRERIVTETRGNPLALLELPRGLTATQLASGFGLLGAQGLSGRIERSFLRRLQALPDDTRLLLLVAAAEPTGDPLLVWGAAERLGIVASSAAGADTDGLLAIDAHVTFRHPLVRSAVYGSASAQDRRAVHQALAEVTDRGLDPDRRAWHLAAAASGPNEEIASELERSAGRAQARGGVAAAAAFLQRSVALTLDANRRGDRALAAAEASLQAGALDSALSLLSTAEAGALGELQRARVELLRAQIAFVSSHGRDAPRLLLKAAAELQPLDAGLARDAYLDALSAVILAGRMTGVDMLEVSRMARATPPATHPPRPTDLLLDGLAALFLDGYAEAVPILRRALAAFGNHISSIAGLRWLFLACVVAVELWEDERWNALSERHVQLARELGALSELPLALTARVYFQLFAGELSTAASLIEEIRTAIEATGSNLAPSCALHLAAVRGREDVVLALIRANTDEVARRGEGSGVALSALASAVLYNGLGRHDKARAAAERIGTEDLTTETWGLVELIEAAARSGSTPVAAVALGRLREMTQISGTDWALGIGARCSAVLMEGTRAEASYRESIERLARTGLRTELARAHLLYGEWLRQENRRAEARAELHTAYDMFAAIGMEAFAERARRELVAAGEKVRKRIVETREELTSQQAQIARLARDGVSNAEIGARLFISPRTVEYHLSKVFAKLGVGSRHELERALPAEGTSATGS